MLMLCLSGCATEYRVVSNPKFPLPDAKVAQELSDNCLPMDKCPALWAWIDELYKLKDQLEKPSNAWGGNML